MNSFKYIVGQVGPCVAYTQVVSIAGDESQSQLLAANTVICMGTGYDPGFVDFWNVCGDSVRKKGRITQISVFTNNPDVTNGTFRLLIFNDITHYWRVFEWPYDNTSKLTWMSDGSLVGEVNATLVKMGGNIAYAVVPCSIPFVTKAPSEMPALINPPDRALYLMLATKSANYTHLDGQQWGFRLGVEYLPDI